jgi:Carbohydrate esterase, sialic acid-specific acetylesterase
MSNRPATTYIDPASGLTQNIGRSINTLQTNVKLTQASVARVGEAVVLLQQNGGGGGGTGGGSTADVTILSGNVSALATRVTAVESGKANAAELLNKASITDLSQTNAAAGFLFNRVNGLEANSALKTDVTATNASVTALTGRVGTLEGTATTVPGRVTTLEAGATALATRVSNVETGKAAASDFTVLNGALTATTARVVTLEGNRARITDLDNLAARVTAVEGGKASLGDVGLLSGSVAQLTNRVTAVEALGQGTKDAVQDSRIAILESALLNVSGYDIILVAGQSNAVGVSGPIDPALDATVDPRIFQFSTTAGTLTQALDPLIGSPANTIGPAMAFAREYIKRIPLSRKVCIVQTAVSGQALYNNRWMPYDNDDVPVGFLANSNLLPFPGDLFRASIAATIQTAISPSVTNPKLAAILWVQGESDAANGVSAANYAASFAALITKYRSNLSGIFGGTTAPFIVGSMVPEYAANAPIVPAHTGIVTVVPYTAFATMPTGFASPTDPIHYSTAGYRLLGKNMNTAFDSAVANKTPTYTIAALNPPKPTQTIVPGTTDMTVTTSTSGDPNALYNRVSYKLTSGVGSTTTYISTVINPNSFTLGSLLPSSSYTVTSANLTREGAVNSLPTVISTLVPLPDVTNVAVVVNATSVVVTWSPSVGAADYRINLKSAVPPFSSLLTILPQAATTLTILNTSLPVGALATVFIDAKNGPLSQSANSGTKTFVTFGSPARYASFLASTGLTLSGATTNITAWADQSGNARNLTSPAAANNPLKTVNAVGTTIIRTSAAQNQGFIDNVIGRILPRNSDYTKMVVFFHNTALEFIGQNANYFSNFGTAGNCSLLWRNQTSTLIASTNQATFQNLNEIASPAIGPGRWYAVFVVFNNTAKTQTMYLNTIAGSVTVAGSSINAQPLTIDGASGVFILDSLNSGAQGDFLEVASWNVALTMGQCAGIVNRLNTTYAPNVF